MSSDVQNVLNDKKEEPKDIVMTIVLPADGSAPKVTGPLMNKPICLFMLEMAKDIVKMWRPEEPKVKPAGGSVIDFARKRFK